MAGIGFSLRKLQRENTFVSTVQAYGTAGVVSSGPWMISIVSILLVGWSARVAAGVDAVIPQFQVAVTYVFAASLILGGPLQLVFTRFVADRVYEERRDLVLPNLFGAIAVQSAISVAFALAAMTWFGDLEPIDTVMLAATLAMISSGWIVIAVLTTSRRYTGVLLAFAVGYLVTVVAARWLVALGLTGLLVAFVLGQAVILYGCLALVVREYVDFGIAFDFLDRQRIVPILAFTGLFYNVGVWADKALFWANAPTSHAVLGPLRASEVYDQPLFLAYLSMVPGMAVFFLRMETDFAEHYEAFYRAIREGESLREIEKLRDAMTRSARDGLIAIAKVQGLTCAFIVAFGPNLLALFGISQLHHRLLSIDSAGVAFQVLLLAVLSVFFYLDRQKTALAIAVLFAVSNIVLTLATQRMGSSAFGFGFAFATLFATLVGLERLSQVFDSLVRDTFLSQRLGA